MKITGINEIDILTHGPNGLFEITDKVFSTAKSINGEGIILIFSKGSTGAIIRIKKKDTESFKKDLWELVPIEGWLHPGNAFAHLRSSLIGTWKLIFVQRNKPLISDDEGIYFLENQVTNARRRKIIIMGINTNC